MTVAVAAGNTLELDNAVRSRPAFIQLRTDATEMDRMRAVSAAEISSFMADTPFFPGLMPSAA